MSTSTNAETRQFELKRENSQNDLDYEPTLKYIPTTGLPRLGPIIIQWLLATITSACASHTAASPRNPTQSPSHPHALAYARSSREKRKRKQYIIYSPQISIKPFGSQLDIAFSKIKTGPNHTLPWLGYVTDAARSMITRHSPRRSAGRHLGCNNKD